MTKHLKRACQVSPIIVNEAMRNDVARKTRVLKVTFRMNGRMANQRALVIMHLFVGPMCCICNGGDKREREKGICQGEYSQFQNIMDAAFWNE